MIAVADARTRSNRRSGRGRQDGLARRPRPLHGRLGRRAAGRTRARRRSDGDERSASSRRASCVHMLTIPGHLAGQRQAGDGPHRGHAELPRGAGEFCRSKPTSRCSFPISTACAPRRCVGSTQGARASRRSTAPRLQLARQQGALALELRAATGLANRLAGSGRTSEGAGTPASGVRPLHRRPGDAGPAGGKGAARCFRLDV